VSAPLLQVSHVTARYGVLPVLHDVSLDIHPREIVALIGANGAGKTTLMMTIFGRPRPSHGRILFAGQNITELPAHAIARLGIAQSPEGRRIFPRMTVMENLQMGSIIAEDADTFDQDLDRVCTLFPVLKARRDQRGGTLSGGEQQMLAIARALMLRPRLLLLDEPSFGLAPIVVQEIFRILGAINREESVSMLLVEQNAHLALALADYVFLLETGRVVMSGRPSLIAGDAAVRRAYLGE
jgi:branched-chain amino acid transport system ATP-binding protein